MNRANRPRLSRISGSSYASKLLGRAGDGSTLSLDFTTGNIGPVTFLRAANTATFINRFGLVESVNADFPRFDYDPNTLTPKGLLIEASAINLCTQGEFCWTGSWGRSSGININSVLGTDGPNAVSRVDGPDGGALTGTSIAKDSGLTFVALTNAGITVTANTSYTFSAFVRAPAGGNNFMRLAAFDGGSWLSTVGASTSPSVTATNIAGGGSRFANVPSNSWVRVWVSFTTGASQTSLTIRFYPDADNSAAATMYVWGAQVEVGSIPSTVIKTSTSTATRNQDIAIIAAGTNFTSWYSGGTTGTFYADWFGGQRTGASGSTVRTVLSTDDVSAKHLHFYQTAAAGNLRVADFGAANTVTTANTLTSGARTKGAFSYNGSTVNLCLNGGTVATSSSIAFSVTPTWLVLGGVSTNGTSITDANVLLNNSIRAIKYWPYPLPNATLQGLTT